MTALAQRMSRIAMSPTMRLAAAAIKLREQGKDVVDFTVGEPDFPTPENVCQAAHRAIDQGQTKYTANEGTLALRRAICRKLEQDNLLAYGPDDVVVSPGAKACLFEALAAVVGPGEEVIIPAPYWVSYPDMVRFAEGRTVIVPTREEDGFRLLPEQLEQAVNFNTRALILNYPSNPCGTTYTREQLRALADICVRHGVLIIADEIYEKLSFDGTPFTSIGALDDAVKALTLTVNGMSKAYAMTGWRLGYAAGPRDWIQAIRRLQSHATSNACSISQAAALEALIGTQETVRYMAGQFERRRNLVVDLLRRIPDVSCHAPRGAFYVFPNVQRYMERCYKGSPIRNSYGLCYYLLETANVALVPGAAFGAEGFVRISFSTSEERIAEGLRRIARALAALEPGRGEARPSVHNTATKVQAPCRLEVVGPEQMAHLVAEAEANLRAEGYFEWNANIAGQIVQLRSNSPHLADFWTENWFPAELESGLEPHAVLYAIKDVAGRGPSAALCPLARSAVLFNTSLYHDARALALALVGHAVEQLQSGHLVQAACVERDGKGLLLLAPAGVEAADLAQEALVGALLAEPGVRLVSLEQTLLRYSAGHAVAELPERKLYARTRLVEQLPALAGLLERSKLENVVTEREACTWHDCPEAEHCRIERGLGHCFSGSPLARAMLDPFWLGGAERHCRRARVHAVAILRHDPTAPALERLDLHQALRAVEAGGAGSAGGRRYFDPTPGPGTLLGEERRRGLFGKLFEVAPPSLVNVGREDAARVAAQVLALLG